MILINNFNQVPDWPAYGYLYGNNILDENTFNLLKDFNFDKYDLTDPTFPNRKCISSSDNFKDNICELLNDLKNYSNNFDVIEPLIDQSFKNSDLTVNNFWTGGISYLRGIQKNVYIQFVEDEPNLFMAPHADHRNVICNIQIYISPNIPEIGTRFYNTGDYTQFKIVPFVPNSGYFSFNTHLSIHSVHNTSRQRRRSIIISWTM